MTTMNAEQNIMRVEKIAVTASAEEALLLREVDPGHLADAVQRQLSLPPAALPDPHPRGTGMVVRAPTLLLPRAAGIVLRPEEASRVTASYAARVIRGALQLVQADYDQGLYRVTTVEEDGRVRRVMQVGEQTVERAVWRSSRDGSRMAGNRPGQWLWAGLGRSRWGDELLFEVQENGELVRLLGALSLFDAATGRPRAEYRPELLAHMRQVRADRAVADQYRIT